MPKFTLHVGRTCVADMKREKQKPGKFGVADFFEDVFARRSLNFKKIIHKEKKQ